MFTVIDFVNILSFVCAAVAFFAFAFLSLEKIKVLCRKPKSEETLKDDLWELDTDGYKSTRTISISLLAGFVLTLVQLINGFRD
jgi:hypothetical protein